MTWRSQSAISAINEYERQNGTIFQKKSEPIHTEIVQIDPKIWERDLRKIQAYAQMEKEISDGTLLEKIVCVLTQKKFISKREQKLSNLESAIEDLQSITDMYKHADSEIYNIFNESVDQMDEIKFYLEDCKEIRAVMIKYAENVKSRIERGDYSFIDPDTPSSQNVTFLREDSKRTAEDHEMVNTSATEDYDKHMGKVFKFHNKNKTKDKLSEISELAKKRSAERELDGLQTDIYELETKMEDKATELLMLISISQFYKTTRENAQQVIRMSSRGVTCALAYLKLAINVDSNITGMNNVLEKTLNVYKSLHEVKTDIDDLVKITNKHIQTLNKYINPFTHYDLTPKIDSIKGDKKSQSIVDKALELYDTI